MLDPCVSLSFSRLVGSPPMAYVAIVEISITAANKNQLAWIRTPAINDFLIIANGHITLKCFP